MTPADGNKVATLVPEPIQGKSPPLAKAIEDEPRLKELYDGPYRELLDIAKTLEGLNRHAGTHAAGVVIGDEPLWEYVPCFRPAGQEGEIIATQFNMTDVEKVGLVKFDFLGLKTLTVIKTAVDLVNAERDAQGRRASSTSRPSRSTTPAVYAMISRADVTGVFQLESSGFRDLLKKLKPDCFEDIVAAGALYRPGPIEGGMVDDFVERKHGRKKVEYAHPALEPILQGHLRRHRLPGAGHADLLGAGRLLAGPGRPASPRDGQEEGRGHGQGEGQLPATARKAKAVDPRIAEGVFDLMEKFAGYGFNRSHSAAYGLLTYQTAYLKHHFPVEFFAGAAHLREGQDRGGGQVHRRGAGAGHSRVAAGRQRVGRRLHGGARRGSAGRGRSGQARAGARATGEVKHRSQQGHPLRPGGGEGRGRGRGRGHPGRARGRAGRSCR